MDDLFRSFVRGLFIIMILFGAGMLAVIFFDDSTLGLRMINVFSSMFVGILGLGSGYLLGRQERNSKNGERRPHDRT